MATKNINIFVLISFVFILTYFELGNKLFQFYKVYFQSSIYENKKFKINLPSNWIVDYEDNVSISFQGFIDENKFTTLRLWLWKNDTVFADNYDNCKSGYSITNIKEGAEVLVCIEDINSSKRPYFTYFFQNGLKYSISTKNYKPYYHREYMEMIKGIVVK